MAATINRNKKQYPIRTSKDRDFYNTSAWINCRTYYLMYNPLCEICKSKGIHKLANEVHHITPLSSVETLEEKFKIGLDVNNLQALCSNCHHNIHNEVRKLKRSSND